uniref:Uncharacterized protein n=1 Tax=Zosterops lateralis melanops TaxID=1220523 RepID=A0A8D2QL61_ZOSLA
MWGSRACPCSPSRGDGTSSPRDSQISCSPSPVQIPPRSWHSLSPGSLESCRDPSLTKNPRMEREIIPAKPHPSVWRGSAPGMPRGWVG